MGEAAAALYLSGTMQKLGSMLHHGLPRAPLPYTPIPAATRRIWIVIFLFLYLVILNFSLHLMIRQPYYTLFCMFMSLFISCNYIKVNLYELVCHQ